MDLQNIGAGNRDDAFYRYKMPKLITKVEGRGNGIKTNLVNMVDVAKALGRPPSYTTKFFGCELGAQSKFDEKTGTSIVNGSHDTSKLVGLLENFIKKYVQCYGCGNPETEVLISKSQLITLKCAACGFLSDVDMRDKLTTFILKNPPEQKKSGKEKKGLRKAEKDRLKEGEAIDEEQKKAKKEIKKKKGHDESKAPKKKVGGSDEDEHSHSPAASLTDEDDADSTGDVQWQTDTSFAAAQQRIKEQLTSVTSEMVMLGSEGESEKSPKDKEGKVPKKKYAEVGADAYEVCKEELSPFDSLVKDLKEFFKEGLTPSQVISKLQGKEGSEQEKINAYFAALFEGVSKGLSKEVAAKKHYLVKVVQDENSQRFLLGAVAAFCGAGDPNTCKEAALVLKVLYDNDILEEEEILQWYDKAVSTERDSKVLRNVKPFIDWLRSAEAESEED